MSGRNGVEIRVGMGSCGIASGAVAVRDALRTAARDAGAADVVKEVGCNGMCHREPLVEVVQNGGQRVLYGNVSAGFARRIVTRHLSGIPLSARARWLAADFKNSWRDGRQTAASGEILDRSTGAAAAYLGK